MSFDWLLLFFLQVFPFKMSVGSYNFHGKIRNKVVYWSPLCAQYSPNQLKTSTPFILRGSMRRWMLLLCHLRDDETEAQGGSINCPWSHPRNWVEISTLGGFRALEECSAIPASIASDRRCGGEWRGLAGMLGWLPVPHLLLACVNSDTVSTHAKVPMGQGRGGDYYYMLSSSPTPTSWGGMQSLVSSSCPFFLSSLLFLCEEELPF